MAIDRPEEELFFFNAVGRSGPGRSSNEEADRNDIEEDRSRADDKKIEWIHGPTDK